MNMMTSVDKVDSEEMRLAKAELISRGYRVSAGSWEDDWVAVAISIESAGPGTYGDAACIVERVKR